MKIVIETPLDGEEDHLVVKCRNPDPVFLHALAALHNGDNRLNAFVGNAIHRVDPADVLYIESVDNKTFLYSAQDVYETKHKLYELEAMGMRDFIRISKSVILNLSKIQSLVPSLSGRLETVLANGERVIISRRYVGALKQHLGLQGGERHGP